MRQIEKQKKQIGKTRLFIVLFSFLIFVTFAIFANSTSAAFSLFVLAVFAVEIVRLVSLINQLKAQKEYLRSMALQRIRTPEKVEKLYVLPARSSFRNKEEVEINAQFLEYLKYKNKRYSVSCHLMYLLELEQALHILKREKEAYDLQPQIKAARDNLKYLEGKAPKYRSRYNDLLYGLTDVHNAYSAFSSALPSVDFYGIKEFFQDSYVKLTKTQNDTAFAFTPAYVIVCEKPSEGLHIRRYSNLSYSSAFYLEKLNGPAKHQDEVHHMGYKYENKDGTRDKRYSMANNPTVPYVYRGSVFIGCMNAVLNLRFPNRDTTDTFRLNYDAYFKLITITYALLIDKLLAHDERLNDYNDLNTYLAVIKKEEQKIQQENERRIRQEEEARLRRRAQELQKRAEEEKRRAEAAKAEEARQKREYQEYQERARKKQEEEARRLAEKKEKELIQARQEKELEAKRSKEEMKKAQELAEEETKKREETERELRKAKDQAVIEAQKRKEIERELQRVRDQATDLSGLSEEERAMILEMRKKRERSGTAKTVSSAMKSPPWASPSKANGSTKPSAAKLGTQAGQSIPGPKSSTSSVATPPKTEYVLQPFDGSKVRLSLQEDKRRITNNIFSLVFEQNAAVGPDLQMAMYEVFAADSDGRVISNVKMISADKTGQVLTHKVSLSLSTQEKFDKQADYYVILRYKDAGNKILSRTKYQINIAFASDFDDF